MNEAQSNTHAYAVSLERLISGKLGIDSCECATMFGAGEIEKHPLMSMVCAAALLSCRGSREEYLVINRFFERNAFFSRFSMDELFLYDREAGTLRNANNARNYRDGLYG